MINRLFVSDRRDVMAKRLLRRALSAPGLLREVRASFDAQDDPVSSRELPGSMIETRSLRRGKCCDDTTRLCVA